MKKIALLTLAGTTTALMAGFSEHAYLYKDARIMGMGGANVAVGGYSSSVFHNPAGLANIKKSHGFEVELLGIGLTASENFKDFADDLDNTETDAEVIDVLQEHDGKPFHFDVANYSSVSKNSDLFAWSVGILAATDFNMMPHANSGTIEAQLRGYGGLMVAGAKTYDDIGPGTLDIGIGIKYIQQKSYETSLTTAEILANQDNLDEYLEEQYEKDGSAVAFDVGAIYKFMPDNYWHPAVGMSIMNIGDLDIDNQYGSQPMTVNIGASVSPEVSAIDRLVIAVDYVDMFNANDYRAYNYDGTHSEFEDSDFTKRLRLGVSAGLVDTSWFMATVNAGLYQGNYTAGIELQAAVLKLTAATYEEEVGPESGQLSDRRYVFGLGIGW